MRGPKDPLISVVCLSCRKGLTRQPSTCLHRIRNEIQELYSLRLHLKPQSKEAKYLTAKKV